MKTTIVRTIYIISLFVFFACGNQKQKTYSNPEIQKGKDIFQAQCRSCHEVHKTLVGPALVNITQKYEEKWLINFIRNSQKMIQEEDKKAIAIYEEYNKAVMPSFTLSDDDIKAILTYIRTESKSVK